MLKRVGEVSLRMQKQYMCHNGACRALRRVLGSAQRLCVQDGCHCAQLLCALQLRCTKLERLLWQALGLAKKERLQVRSR